MKQYTFKHTVHACYLGYVTQAIVTNLAPLLFVLFQTNFSISFEMIGRLVLINFGTQLLVDIIAVNFVDKIGYRVATVAAHLFAAAGLILLCVLPNLMTDHYAGIVISVVIYAIGGGMIEVLISPLVNGLPGEAKASSMSLLHSFYCWGQVLVVLVTTLLLSWIGNGMWFVIPLIWAALPIYNCFKFMVVPLPPTVPDGERIPIKQLVGAKIFMMVMVLMLSAGASEMAMSQWASLFAEEGLHVPKMFGDILGPCLFAVFMGIGRTVYGIWGHKIHLIKALAVSAGMCIACYSIAALAANPIVSLMGCAFCGLSVSLMWPGMLSYSASLYPKGGTAMFGILAICGDLGCSLGPWLTGVVSDVAQGSEGLISFGTQMGYSAEQMGLKTGILFSIVFPIMMLIGVLIIKRMGKRKLLNE